MIRAVVFDFDGLILDTETHEYRCWLETFHEQGAVLPLEVWGRGVGTDSALFSPYDYLEECVGRKIDREALKKRHADRFAAKMETESVRPGVERYLLSAKELGLKIGLASSSNRTWVMNYLILHRLDGYFECIRTSDDVRKVKPDPELYLQTVGCLGVSPSEALAFEDSPNGALAARRAGLHCVIVPNQVTAGLVFGEHSRRLNSMTDIGLAGLLAAFEEE